MNEYFRETVTPDELVWSFSGVRALYDDGADRPEDVTRDYELVLDERYGEAPLLTVYGGKITTHRKLAEAAMARDRHVLRSAAAVDRRLHAAGRRLSARRLLSAGGRDRSAAGRFCRSRMRAAWCAPMAGALERILGEAQSMEDLGPRFTGDLTAAEVRYLVENEWAQTADDVLWRRSKLGLKATPEERSALEPVHRVAERTQRVAADVSSAPAWLPKPYRDRHNCQGAF